MSYAVALLALRAYSGIHAGIGQESGVVDLPIQREGITNHPIIRGPSLKGALRQAAQDRGTPADAPMLNAIFGPESLDKGNEHAGALSVGDARLVLFPMRSLKGTFAWTSCPLSLLRLQRELEDTAIPAARISLSQTNWPDIANDQVWVSNASRLTFAAGPNAQNQRPQVVLEDIGLQPVANPAPAIAAWDLLTSNLATLGVAETELDQRLAVVDDDLFQAFVSFYTEIVTRVHLDDVTKTVKKGQLWTEELLPAESLLVAVLVCDKQRIAQNGQARKSGKALLDDLRRLIGPRLQIGGNETVGYGICHATWLGPCEINCTREA